MGLPSSPARDARASSATPQSTPLALAAEHGQRDAAFELLWRGADAASLDGVGTTPGGAAAGAGRPDVAALLAAWPRGELRVWSRAAHAAFPAPFRANVAAVLLATLGTAEGGVPATATVPGSPRRHNPLRELNEHSLLCELFRVLLPLHMGGPSVLRPPPAPATSAGSDAGEEDGGGAGAALSASDADVP